MLFRRYIWLSFVFATWLGACGHDSDDSAEAHATNNACVPGAFRGTCLEQFYLEYGGCFDPEGACTWSDPDAGLMFEWANGARVEVTGELSSIEGTRSYSSGGRTCFVSTPLATDACVGAREEINGTWIEICVDHDGASTDGALYRCQNGREYHISSGQVKLDPAACPAATDLSKCVDKNGVLIEDRM